MRRFGVVVFGASVFDFQSHLNNPRFKKSAEEFQRVIADSKVLPDCEIETLDLYDKPLSTGDTIDEILKFTAGDHDDYILYYCGHGTVGIRESDYKVLLRRTVRDNTHTLLNPNELLRDVKRRTTRKRVYLILDSCYSGAAVSETMRAGDETVVIERRLQQVVMDGGRGTAVFTSAGRLGVAIAKEEDEVTLFTGAFVRCLRKGIAEKSGVQRFSWQDLRDEIVRVTAERMGSDAPVPQLISFSQTASDITRVDFFSNQAFVAEAPAQPGPTNLWEVKLWETLTALSPALAYDDFLAKFPNGMFAVPARIRLSEKINGFAEQDLEEYIQDHPNSGVMDQLDRRLAELKWNHLRNSSDTEELKGFVQRFPRSKLKREAENRIAAIGAAQPPPVEPHGFSSASGQAQDKSQDAKADEEKTHPPRPSPPFLRWATLVAGVFGVIGLIAYFSSQQPSPPPSRPDWQPSIALAPPSPPRSANNRANNATNNSTRDSTADAPPATTLSFNSYANFDIDQHDIDISRGITYDACKDKCQLNSSCVAFIFDKWNNACYLKDQVGPLLLDPHYVAVIRSDQGQPVQSGTSTNSCLYRNKAMSGEVAGTFSQSSASSCKAECEGNNDCVAYTYLKSERRCSILNSVSSRPRDDTNAESGTRMQNSC